MKKPSPLACFTAASFYVAIPGGQVVKQLLEDGKITQKLPPSIGVQVVLTTASTDTGPVLGPVADLTLGRMIRMPEPEKPGQVQLPIKGVSDTA